MISKTPAKALHRAIEIQKDFFEDELLKMGFFKTKSGKQLYELSLCELEYIYHREKARLRNESNRRTTADC